MSQFKTFVVARDASESEESELNAFLRAHRIVSIAKVYDAGAWCFCVEWMDGKGTDCVRTAKYGERLDYMKVLPQEQFAVFAKLREKRKELAQAAGVPPFSVATDAQLAEMVKKEHPTSALFKEIDGFGESRIKAYGQAFLAILEDAAGGK